MKLNELSALWTWWEKKTGKCKGWEELFSSCSAVSSHLSLLTSLEPHTQHHLWEDLIHLSIITSTKEVMGRMALICLNVIKGREDDGTPATPTATGATLFWWEVPRCRENAGRGPCSPSALLVDDVRIKWTQQCTQNRSWLLLNCIEQLQQVVIWSDDGLQVCACKDSESKFGVCRPTLNSHFFSDALPQDLFQFPPLFRALFFDILQVLFLYYSYPACLSF